MDFDTARFRAFANVAERGTVAAAAEALGYTGPAVSQQIAKLEAQLDARLFDRIDGRLRLSAAGQRLLPLALDLLDTTDRAAGLGAQALPARPVAIAGFASAITELVIPAVRERDLPPIRLHETEDDEALRELRLGTVDIAITQEYDLVPAERSDRLRYTELAHDRLRLVAPPDVRPGASLATLAARGWLVNGSGTRCEEATHQVLRRAGITPNIVGRVGDNHALLALVAAGLGATIAPELVVRGSVANVTIARADLGASRRIVAVTRAGVASQLAPVVALLRRR